MPHDPPEESPDSYDTKVSSSSCSATPSSEIEGNTAVQETTEELVESMERIFDEVHNSGTISQNQLNTLRQELPKIPDSDFLNGTIQADPKKYLNRIMSERLNNACNMGKALFDYAWFNERIYEGPCHYLYACNARVL